jgi:hypothetical protein
MKYVKLLMALLAVCILIIPAFSMPDFGNAVKDCKEPVMGGIAQGKQPCDCHKDKMGPVGDWPCPKSMMDGCDKPMMGPVGDYPAPKSMMDGCNKPMMGPDGEKLAPKPLSGPDDEENQDCQCQGQ